MAIDKQLLEIYTDFSFTTATGLSMWEPSCGMAQGEISHDILTRFLSLKNFTSADLWAMVKPAVMEIESDYGVLIIDDTIEEKPGTDENEIVNWHYYHRLGRAVSRNQRLTYVNIIPIRQRKR